MDRLSPGTARGFCRPQTPYRFYIRFFESVNSQQTSTRLFAIKAPSGMGKSSVVLKVTSMVRARNYSKKYFLYAVDVRTAMSSRYVELVLKGCFDKAAESGFFRF